MHCVSIHEFTQCIFVPPLIGSSTLERFEHNNASEIRNGIMFDFYPGLPQM